jgi:hypothetical protein
VKGNPANSMSILKKQVGIQQQPPTCFKGLGVLSFGLLSSCMTGFEFPILDKLQTSDPCSLT